MDRPKKWRRKGAGLDFMKMTRWMTHKFYICESEAGKIDRSVMSRMQKRSLAFLCLTGISLWIVGCATIETPTEELFIIQRRGVYHKLGKGETLWRISKAYHVSIEEIIRANNIPDAAHVEENQLVFIPGATEVLPIVVEDEDPRKDEFSWPVRGEVASFFNDRKGGHLSQGIGITARLGGIAGASRQGHVIFSDYLPGYAHTVIVDHHDGYCTVYARHAKNLVGVGEFVNKGMPLGEVGATGSEAFLYFEIRKNTVADNPLYYLPKL